MPEMTLPDGSLHVDANRVIDELLRSVAGLHGQIAALRVALADMTLDRDRLGVTLEAARIESRPPVPTKE